MLRDGPFLELPHRHVTVRARPVLAAYVARPIVAIQRHAIPRHSIPAARLVHDDDVADLAICADKGRAGLHQFLCDHDAPPSLPAALDGAASRSTITANWTARMMVQR